jgi:hypothetical protein
LPGHLPLGIEFPVHTEHGSTVVLHDIAKRKFSNTSAGYHTQVQTACRELCKDMVINSE